MKGNVEVGRSCKNAEAVEGFIFVDYVNNNN